MSSISLVESRRGTRSRETRSLEELEEELGVAIVEANLFSVVSDEAALEGVAMEMKVYLVRVGGPISTRAEIAALAWVGADGEGRGGWRRPYETRSAEGLATRQLIA